jgi:hypothetical protein
MKILRVKYVVKWMKWNESSEIYTGERKLCRWALWFTGGIREFLPEKTASKNEVPGGNFRH